MTMDTFKAEYLSEGDTVTVDARQLQELLINYDELKRVNKLLNETNNAIAYNNQRLKEQLEECSNTHITLDLKV